MEWFERFRAENGQGAEKKVSRSDALNITCIADIPEQATPSDAFRLIVEVVKVYERTTNAGDPCFFLHCRDAQGMKFSIVLWDWQMERLKGKVDEGMETTLEVRVPREGFSAFSLA